MTSMSAGFITAVVLTAGLSFCPTGSLVASQEKKADQKAAASVAGSWTMSVKGPHGATAMSLALEQDGKKITGTFATPHGDLKVEGEFVDRTLTLATAEAADSRITLKAELKDGGTLDGYLSSQMGDMTWTAERVKGK